MGQAIGQICINVSDLERSIEFWRDTLGIPLKSRTEIPTALEAVFQADEGGSRIQLAQQLDQQGPIDHGGPRFGAGPGADGGAGGYGGAVWKLYIYTDDVAALHQKCLDAGCESVMEPTDLDRWPVTVSFVRDVDGYLFELIENHEGVPAGMPDMGSTRRSR